MQIIIHKGKNDKNVAEIISDEIVINNVRDALDIMANADYQDAMRIAIYEKNISSEFFNLRSGLAGEIMQKFVTYQVKLAIIGDFEKYNSNSLKSFIIESNRGSQFFFVNDFLTAKDRLSNV